MTRLEAIRVIRAGGTLIKIFYPAKDKVSSDLEVWIRCEQFCNFKRSRLAEHEKIGPIHLRFWSGSTPHWIHITPRQLLRFIKRNYGRSKN